MVSFTHGQNIICSQAQLDDIAHEQTIICRQFFAGHVVGSRPMKRKKNLHRKILTITERVNFYKQVNSVDTEPRKTRYQCQRQEGVRKSTFQCFLILFGSIVLRIL